MDKKTENIKQKNTQPEPNNSKVKSTSTAKKNSNKPTGGKKPASVKSVKALEKQLHEKEKIIEELNEKFKLLNDKYLRLSAEFDNYRKRTLKEKMNLTKSAGHAVITNLLPVIDDLDRATTIIKETDDIEAVKKGIELIYNKFHKFLKQQGIEAIEAVGKEFNTDEHEAMTKIPAPKEALKGKVIEEIQKGYKSNDQILRYSKVVVGE
ncbi:MAG: nucleotide exchange factor GrpE [Bacteroidales bacterium]